MLRMLWNIGCAVLAALLKLVIMDHGLSKMGCLSFRFLVMLCLIGLAWKPSLRDTVVASQTMSGHIYAVPQ